MQQPKILVAIRKRPLNKKQQTRGDQDIISVKNTETLIADSDHRQKVDLTKYLQETVFNFDYAYDQNTTNQQIYDTAVRPLVDSAFQGAKVTCFAYGQTGSGKTFTMNGLPGKGVTGLYTLGAQDIFAYLSDPRFSHLKARLSFFQIYCGKLFDLLNKRQQLKIRQDNKANINIIGLQETIINNWEQFIQLLNYGATQRVTSQNSANPDSSRSHAILQISLKDGKKLCGKISFIDLAGNERGADHMDMSKQTRIDGAQINKSLLSLKECIRALDQGKGHTPFRGSKLTMVLKDSFVGFCKTVMIGNISPSSASSQNTLNTLRYADRVKQLRKPQNGPPLTKQDLKARQMMLPRQNNKNVLKIDIDKQDDAEDIQKKRENAQRSYKIIADEKQMLLQPPHPSSLGHNSNGMKRQASNGNINPSTQKQQMQGQMLLPGKQPGNSNNLAKINTTNVRKSPLIGSNSASQRQQHLYRGYSDQAEVTAPQTLFKNSSVNVNSNQYESTRKGGEYSSNSNMMSRSVNPGVHRVVGFQGRTDIENGVKVPPQNNNYFQPRKASEDNFHQNLKSRQTESRQVEAERSSPLKFKNNLNPRGQVQSKNVPIIQNVPPLFSQKSNPMSSAETDYEIPNNWEEAIEMISTTEDPNLMLRLQESISESLIIEESNLMEKHSNTLRKQIDTIKDEMGLISKVESNRNAISTRDYVAFLQESIQQKLSSLELLREHLAQFTYKLDQMEEVEERIKGVEGTNFEDEQLLDDLH